MPVLTYSGLKINVDDDGFLENPDDWNEKVACALAEKEGVEETHQRQAGNYQFPERPLQKI